MVDDTFVQLRGLKFHYREWSRRGTPLVLLHGLASQAHVFDRMAPMLAKRFRVIAFDQRGHGESAKPDAGYDFPSISADLTALLDAIGMKRAIVAGHSWGGNVALDYAVYHPTRVRAIVLIDGGFLDLQADPTMTWERTRKELAPPDLAGMPVYKFKQLLKEYAGAVWRPWIEEIVLQNFEILPDQTIRPRLKREKHMKILRALWEQRPCDLYARVACPALLIPAVMETDHNRAWVERRRTLVEIAAREIKKNRVVWFRNTVHDIPLQRPRKLANTVTRFAEEHHLLKH